MKGVVTAWTACEKCGVGPTYPTIAMQWCGKCQVAPYCSRKCRKAHFEKHKHMCKNMASHDIPPFDYQKAFKLFKPFEALLEKTWLHRPQQVVFRLLLDCFRLRVADNSRNDSDLKKDTSAEMGEKYDAAVKAFKTFMNYLEQRQIPLPVWWSDEKLEGILSFIAEQSQNKGDHDILKHLKASDIIQHYGDKTMPMQMRLFAEQVMQRSRAHNEKDPPEMFLLEGLIMAEKDGEEAVLRVLEKDGGIFEGAATKLLLGVDPWADFA